MMKKFYFTFGFGQENQNCYTIIEAEDRNSAREEMMRRFGPKWSMQYDSAEAAGVERFGLELIY